VTPGRVIGTKLYMSPEQIRNFPVTPTATCTPSAACSTNSSAARASFDATEEVALMYQRLETAPTPLRQIEPSVPVEVERLARARAEQKLPELYDHAVRASGTDGDLARDIHEMITRLGSLGRSHFRIISNTRS
jgi:hypothetical protein